MKLALSLLVGVLGLSSIASASSGLFCNPQNQVVEWVCQEYPQGRNWVAQPDGCYHRNTQRSCDGYNRPDRPGWVDLRNSMFQVSRQYGTYYADQYSNYCAFRSDRQADRFRRRYFPGRSIVVVREIPRDLRYVGICQVNNKAGN